MKDLFRIACFIALEFKIHRYLMSNAYGRWDGFEKAEKHIEMVEFYLRVYDIKRRTALYEEAFELIHIETQKKLTDHLDEKIGFPLNSRPDYEVLAPKFHNIFHDTAIAVLEKYKEIS